MYTSVNRVCFIHLLVFSTIQAGKIYNAVCKGLVAWRRGSSESPIDKTTVKNSRVSTHTLGIGRNIMVENHDILQLFGR